MLNSMQSCYSSLFTVVSPQNVVSVYVCQIWVKIGFYWNRKWKPVKVINQFFPLPGRWTICFCGPNNSSKNGARQAMGWRTGDWLFWCRSVGAEIWCCQLNIWNTSETRPAVLFPHWLSTYQSVCQNSLMSSLLCVRIKSWLDISLWLRTI